MDAVSDKALTIPGVRRLHAREQLAGLVACLAGVLALVWGRLGAGAPPAAVFVGLALIGLGWALFVQGWLTLAWAGLLLVFFDIKSRREEAWLMARFPTYAAYRKRVRKLIPYLY